MATKQIEDFQKQTLEMFRAQQEAYLNAVKTWRDAMSGGATPAATHAHAPKFDEMPTPAEMAEAGYAFASRLMADQSRFLEELGRTMTSMYQGGGNKARKGA